MRARPPAFPRLSIVSLASLCALAVLAACGDPAPTAPPASAPVPVKRPVPTSTPSVVLIGLSGVRFDDVHVAAGSSDAPRMPTFAAFGRDHTEFLQVQSAAAWEVPSIASVLTGLIPSGSGVRGVGDLTRPTMISAVETIAEMVKREGYATAAFVPGGVLTFANQLDQGFEGAWTEGFRLESGAETVAGWLAARAKDKPFLLLLLGDATLPQVPADVAESERAHWAAGVHEKRVREIDAGLAAILGVLEKAALPADTLTIVFSDHGDALLDRSAPALLGRGGGLFEEQVHVPLAIAAPGVLAKGAVRGSCSLVDVFPTVRDAMGLPPASGDVAGRSLRPLATDPSAPGLPAVAEEWRRVATDDGPVEHRYYAVRTASWKWVADFVDRPPTWTERLFDLQADPHERTPLEVTDLAPMGKEFAAQVEVVRGVLKGSRKTLTDPIVSGYVAGSSGTAPKRR